MHLNGDSIIRKVKAAFKNKDFVVCLIEDAIVLYLLFAGGYSLCYVASSVLEKLGVG